ncbi:MAG: hypothetical protein JKY11_05195 [Alphaproteobacteria bacterium]|nr:hypothetical protein [Alphaproteobacteria bacterium]
MGDKYSEIEFYLPNGLTYVEPVGQLSAQRFFNPGASLTTKVFQKNVSSVVDFNRLQKEKESDFEEFAREFAGRYGISVEIGQIKGDQSLEKKILSHQGFFRQTADNSTDVNPKVVCTIHDGLRARFYVTKRAQLAKLANRLTVSQNSNIVDVQDGFMTLNEENGIPRYKVIYDFEGFNVELQIYHQGMENALRQTDKDHKRQRAYDQAFTTPKSALTDWKLATLLSRGSKRCETNRLSIHNEYRAKLKLDRFVVSDEERQFYLSKKGGYFYTAPDPYEFGRPVKSMRPDFHRGMYVIDNSMSDYIAGSKVIPKESFVSGVLTAYQESQFPQYGQGRIETNITDQHVEMVNNSKGRSFT